MRRVAIILHIPKLEPLEGIEPPTRCLQDSRSTRLSHKGYYSYGGLRCVGIAPTVRLALGDQPHHAAFRSP